jgi:fructokinase
VSIAVLGEALIDFIVGDDGAYRPHLGGSPFNVAIGLARQGVPVSYLSPFSDDAFGDRLRDALIAEGVALPLDRRSLWPTSLALVTIDEAGLPTYRLYREGIADKDTSFEEIADNLPADLEIFHTGSLAITPSQLPKIREVFALLRERGVLISIDLNIRLRASVDTAAYLAGVRGLLPAADIVKASDEDIEAFAIDADARTSAEVIFEEMAGGILLLTEGRGGAVLRTERGMIEKHAYPIAKIEDTVGAGDTFHAAFLAAMCGHGAPAELMAEPDEGIFGAAVDFACAAAAINVSRKGCSPPTADEVRQFVAASQR